MLLWYYSLLLLWGTTSVLTVNKAKLDPKILSEHWPYMSPNVFVSFGSTQPALEAAKREQSSGTIAERAGNVRRHLMKLAEEQQAGVIYMLVSRKKCEFESMWLSNRIFIKEPDKELVYEISDFLNVTYIREEIIHYVNDESARWTDQGNMALRQTSKNDPNVTKGLELIKAPEAWKVLGGSHKAGEGVIVGVLDTGAYAGHEILVENFVGMSYGYLDTAREPIQQANDVTHGTHVTGTIVGRNGIGVAPAAKHSQCRACEKWYCIESSFEKCMAFFICPTLQNGTQLDCSRRVHIIHMSFWADSPSIKPIVDSAISAGILLVAPMGFLWYRTGQCKEGTYPGLFDEVIAVGIVNNTDHLEDRSAKGPNPNPTGNPKPDVVAPGVDILSAHYKDPEYKYIAMTGPLTATAHVTGVVALLLTRDKTLTQDQVRKLIIENTDRPHASKSECNNGSRNLWPNPEFGYGRINALKAINAQTKMLTGTSKNESKLENTCQQGFDSYKQRLNEKLRNINSVSILIWEELQKLVEHFNRIVHEIAVFNVTLKTLLNKATQLETSLKALENN